MPPRPFRDDKPPDEQAQLDAHIKTLLGDILVGLHNYLTAHEEMDVIAEENGWQK